jgi:TolA-binding protein
MPGKYKVSLSLVTRNEINELVAPKEFNVVVLGNTSLPPINREEVVAFQRKAAELARKIIGTQKYVENLVERIEYIKQTINNTPGIKPELLQQAIQISKELNDILFTYNGQPSKASAEEVPPQPVPLNSRLSIMIYTQYISTSNVTLNQKRAYEILQQDYPPILEKVKKIESNEIKLLEAELEKAGAPWTPGRLPDLK